MGISQTFIICSAWQKTSCKHSWLTIWIDFFPITNLSWSSRNKNFQLYAHILFNFQSTNVPTNHSIVPLFVYFKFQSCFHANLIYTFFCILKSIINISLCWINSDIHKNRLFYLLFCSDLKWIVPEFYLQYVFFYFPL